MEGAEKIQKSPAWIGLYFCTCNIFRKFESLEVFNSIYFNNIDSKTRFTSHDHFEPWNSLFTSPFQLLLTTGRSVTTWSHHVPQSLTLDKSAYISLQFKITWSKSSATLNYVSQMFPNFNRNFSCLVYLYFFSVSYLSEQIFLGFQFWLKGTYLFSIPFQGIIYLFSPQGEILHHFSKLFTLVTPLNSDMSRLLYSWERYLLYPWLFGISNYHWLLEPSAILKPLKITTAFHILTVVQGTFLGGTSPYSLLCEVPTPRIHRILNRKI